ncbi:MAG: lysylphosphatidylglycerol synthase transmembrane domain-containing protein [bacterium]
MNRSRRITANLLRLALAAVVLFWLFRKLGGHELLDALKESLIHWHWLLAAHLLMLLPLAICMLRWKLILNSQSMPLTWPRVAAIFMIGQFFNTFMLGATGGDLMKAWYTARASHQRKAEAVTTIVLDRFAGLLGLLLLITFILLARLPFFLSHRETRLVALLLLAVCATVFVGTLLLLRTPIIPWLLRHPRLRSRFTNPIVFIERIYSVFRTWAARPTLLAQTVGLSLAMQLISVASSICYGHALGVSIRIWDYLTFLPLANSMGAIPATPGGIGIREAVSVQLLGALQVRPETAFLLPFLPAFSLILWSLAGGLVFLFYRQSATTSINMDSATRVAPLS